MLLGIAAQTAEFVGWGAAVLEVIKGEIGTLGGVAYGILGWQIVLYIYAIRFIFGDHLPLKHIIQPLLYVDFVASFGLSFFYFYQVASQGSGAADLITLVLVAVFFGSDMFLCGGLVYIIQNYVPAPTPTPTLPKGAKYMIIGADGKPQVIDGQVYQPPVLMV